MLRNTSIRCLTHKKTHRYLTISFFLVFLSCFAFQGRAENRIFHYTGEQELSLNGDWRFYWKQLLYSGDSALDTSGLNVEMPNYWNDHKNKGYVPIAFGYATYRTTIICDKDRDIALEYAGPHCAQRIYLNGELIVTTGKVGTTPEQHQGLWLSGTVKANLNKGENELIIQISNFNHSKGGIYKSPTIGQATYLLSKRNRNLFLDTFVAGGLFIMGIFFLGLSIFWRNNRLFIYFGLFSVLFSFWYINFGTHALKVCLPTINWSLSIHLTYLAFYGFSFFFSLFVYDVFKGYFGEYYLKTILIGYTLLFSTVIFGSPLFFTSFILYAYILIFSQLLYVAILLINVVRIKVKKSVWGILVIVTLTLASLIVLAWFFRFLPWISETLGLLFLLTFLLFAILMSRKVGGDYRSILQLQEETIVQKEKIQEQAIKLRMLDEMKTRFFANVSHDLRSPLTLIKGSVYRLRKENAQLAIDFQTDFNSIDASVNQLIQFTDEIRDLNLLDQRAFSISYSEIEVNVFMKGISDMFQSLAEVRGIDLSFIGLQDNLSFIGDESKIRRALNNLLSNAFKFTDDNGKIELSVNKTQNGILIKLKDSGLGIHEEDQPFVFDRFYQGKGNSYRSEEGMGIGLALVKELISLHEGKVSLESRLGEGTVFSLFLPYNHDKPLSKEQTASEQIIISTAKINDTTGVEIDFSSSRESTELTILLVDDYHDVRKYIASVIDNQYHVIEAKNGAEAYEILKKQKVDLVITDLMMPWMDGFELIDKMNTDTELSRVKIMVVSARTTHDDKLKVLNKGVNEFISKPFDEEEFNKRVANILKGIEPSLLHDLAEKKGRYSDLEKNILLKLNNLIMDQIDNSKLTISVLADKLATSERNSNRIIKKLTGLPPKAYIQKVRMNFAELLLKEGKVKNLTEAGNAIGMKNTSQFAKQFEKVKGYHPSKARSVSKQ